MPDGWVDVRLSRQPLGADAPRRTAIAEHVVELVFDTGWALRIDRIGSSVVFFAPSEATDDEVVHPYLAPAAIRFAGWHGRAALHAGAFVSAGGAWGLLAAREGGKSTTLGRLALSGVPVLADDLLVVERAGALAGPRCIDLRPSAASGGDPSLKRVRSGERLRLPLDPVPACVPLHGFFFLEWGETLALEELRPAERLSALARRFRTGGEDPAQLLDLARLPAWRLVRPADPASLDGVCERLLDAALD